MPRDVREQGVYAYAFESTPASASIKALGMFARVSQRAEAESAFRRLLHAAVGAEPESYQQADETRLAAVAILIRHPELLFRDDRITDHFGRKIVASPYRLLLGSGDVWALKQVHEEIIAKIQDETIRAATQAKAQDQFQQQFPDPFCALALFTN